MNDPSVDPNVLFLLMLKFEYHQTRQSRPMQWDKRGFVPSNSRQRGSQQHTSVCAVLRSDCQRKICDFLREQGRFFNFPFTTTTFSTSRIPRKEKSYKLSACHQLAPSKTSKFFFPLPILIPKRLKSWRKTQSSLKFEFCIKATSFIQIRISR